MCELRGIDFTRSGFETVGAEQAVFGTAEITSRQTSKRRKSWHLNAELVVATHRWHLADAKGLLLCVASLTSIHFLFKLITKSQRESLKYFKPNLQLGVLGFWGFGVLGGG